MSFFAKMRCCCPPGRLLVGLFFDLIHKIKRVWFSQSAAGGNLFLCGYFRQKQKNLGCDYCGKKSRLPSGRGFLFARLQPGLLLFL